MLKVYVLMRMEEDGSDGEMLSAHASEDGAKRARLYAVANDGESMARLEIFPVDFEA